MCACRDDGTMPFDLRLRTVSLSCSSFLRSVESASGRRVVVAALDIKADWSAHVQVVRVPFIDGNFSELQEFRNARRSGGQVSDLLERLTGQHLRRYLLL